MKDEKIIELFFARDEKALEAVSEKFSRLCRFVASNFLCMREDREECFNDTLLALWNSIPPERPENLPAYVSATARNQAVNRSRAANAWKRGGQVQFVNEECLSLIADGKFGDCVILARTGWAATVRKYVIEGKEYWAQTPGIFVYRNGEIFDLTQAYENGWLNADQIDEIFNIRFPRYTDKVV